MNREDMDRDAQAFLDDEKLPCIWCPYRVRFGDAVRYTDGSVAHKRCDELAGKEERKES